MHTVFSATLRGVEALPCEVEVDIAGGLPSVDVVGLAEAAVREARVRVRAAIVNTGFAFPIGRVAVNLAPAHSRKDGTGYDLPIAMAVLAAHGDVPATLLPDVLVVGELSLDGSVRPVRGALLAAEAARKAGRAIVVVPRENGAEAALVPGVQVRTVTHLRDVVAWLKGNPHAAPVAVAPPPSPEGFPVPDLADVRGQPFARRALEGYERTLGRYHPSTRVAATCLRMLLKEMEKEMLPGEGEVRVRTGGEGEGSGKGRTGNKEDGLR